VLHSDGERKAVSAVRRADRHNRPIVISASYGPAGDRTGGPHQRLSPQDVMRSVQPDVTLSVQAKTVRLARSWKFSILEGLAKLAQATEHTSQRDA
jgi:hypothetical protein